MISVLQTLKIDHHAIKSIGSVPCLLFYFFIFFVHATYQSDAKTSPSMDKGSSFSLFLHQSMYIDEEQYFKKYKIKISSNNLFNVKSFISQRNLIYTWICDNQFKIINTLQVMDHILIVIGKWYDIFLINYYPRVITKHRDKLKLY